MIKNIIRYVGLSLVIVGIVLVMRNLFSTTDSSQNWSNKTISNSKVYYEANIKLLDNDTKDYIVGANLVLKNSESEVVEKWTTTDKEHTIVKLEKGTYTLEQTESVDGYEKSDKVITFKITDEDKNIVMYNTAITEEVKETASEVNVDNTLSMKNSLSIVIAMGIVFVGVKMILCPNKRLVITEN